LTRKLIVGLAALGLVMSSIGVAIGAQQERQQEAETRYKVKDGEVTSEAGIGSPDDQHGTQTDHLPAVRKNMKLISKLRLTRTPGAISDVNYGAGHAYLGAYAPACTTDEAGVTTGGGVHIVDIRDPQNPRKVGFLESPPGSYVSEGVDFLRRRNPATGARQDLLLSSNESCGAGSPGGINIYDVTNPRAPVTLTMGAGDRDLDDDPSTPDDEGRANFVHSVMGFNQGNRTFAVLVDNEELLDVDILDITNPLAPVLVSESGLPQWPAAQDDLAHQTSTFHHDMWVKKFDGHYWLMVSYWDAGQILLNVDDPSNPVYVDDQNYPDPDTLTGHSPPEGNAHQGTWSQNNEYFISTDEDFSPYRLTFRITSGPNEGQYTAGEFGFTIPIKENFGDEEMNGPTVWGGQACDTDPPPPPEDNYDDNLAAGEEVVLVVTRGGCFFSIKVENAQDAGYKAVIIGNSHFGTNFNEGGDGPLCGSQGHEYEKTASAVCTGHGTMHRIFNDEVSFECQPEGCDMPPLGTTGEKVSARPDFDGWGYVRQLDADTLEEIDAYAVDEALDERFAFGFGALSVHEIKTDQRKGMNLGYISYYSAGARVIRFGENGMREKGVFIDKGGNDFWGVFPVKRGDKRPLILESDRDLGLYILKYTGPEPGEVVSRGACRGYEMGSRTDRRGGGQVIVGTDGNDVLNGTGEADVICGLGGNDAIDGNDGGDDIFGNGGDDTITGGQGKDTIRGNAGRDAVDGKDGNDVILGGRGIDTLRGNNEWDTIKGGGGRDTLQGGDGNDVLRGGNSNDTLKGFSGDDILNGEAGTDTCDGGTGDNTLRSCER
jgi:hypothetical protein